MQLVMLSGNSLRNQTWIYEARDQVARAFDSTYVQNYYHWQTDEDWIDLAKELKSLRDQTFAPDYGIFAKSIGTVLTVKALKKKIITPKFLLLMGLPLNYIVEKYPQFADVLSSCALPTTIIHNTNDKVGSAKSVREYLGDSFSRADFKFIETPGNTHDYEDYKILKAELASLIETTKS